MVHNYTRSQCHLQPLFIYSALVLSFMILRHEQLRLEDLIPAVPDEDHHPTLSSYLVEVAASRLPRALCQPIDILLCRHCRDLLVRHITLDYRVLFGVFLPGPHDRWPVFLYQFCIVLSHCLIPDQRC